MSGVIYKITSGDECYVGSTNDYDRRWESHRDTIWYEIGKHYNAKLYKTIRANDGDWEMSIYEENLSITTEELRIREEEVRLLLGATLNSKRAYRTREQKREQLLNADARKGVKITCECGSIVTRGCIIRHRTTTKHARRMTSLSQA